MNCVSWSILAENNSVAARRETLETNRMSIKEMQRYSNGGFILSLVISMLVLALLSLLLAVHAARSCSVALEIAKAVSTADEKGRSDRHTLILLSRHGTHAVVTCFRGAFLVCAGAVVTG